ncbi:unnamed protein product [Linum trigynum]|uniref:Uncharacterized protein n=1 Tax=Linum trigynum TaxID=586398 RepID=A0AAV2F9Q3_9ROSI
MLSLSVSVTTHSAFPSPAFREEEGRDAASCSRCGGPLSMIREVELRSRKEEVDVDDEEWTSAALYYVGNKKK